MISDSVYPLLELSVHDGRWDEKSGLQRDALSSQIIDVLEAQEIREAGCEAIAVARKLAVLLHRLWVSGDVYVPLRQVGQAAVPAVA